MKTFFYTAAFLLSTAALITTANAGPVEVNNEVLNRLGPSPADITDTTLQDPNRWDLNNSSAECQEALKRIGDPLNPRSSVPVVCLKGGASDGLSMKQRMLLDKIASTNKGVVDYRSTTSNEMKIYSSELPDQLGGTKVINSKTVAERKRKEQEIKDKLKREQEARAAAEQELATLKGEVERLRQQQQGIAIQQNQEMNAPSQGTVNPEGELVLNKPRILVPTEPKDTTPQLPPIPSSPTVMEQQPEAAKKPTEIVTKPAGSDFPPAQPPMTAAEFAKLPPVKSDLKKDDAATASKGLFPTDKKDEKADLSAPVKPIEQTNLTPQNTTAPLPKFDTISKDLLIRVPFAEKSEKVDGSQSDSLAKIGADIAHDKNQRIQVIAYASGDENSAARRLSLTRALAVRSALESAGVDKVQIDVRALGNSVNDEPKDRVDIFKVN